MSKFHGAQQAQRDASECVAPTELHIHHQRSVSPVSQPRLEIYGPDALRLFDQPSSHPASTVDETQPVPPDEQLPPYKTSVPSKSWRDDLQLFEQTLASAPGTPPFTIDEAQPIFHDEDELPIPERPTPLEPETPPSSPPAPSAPDSPDKWEALKIIGEEAINNQTHYMVAWKPTLEPESNLTYLSALIAE